jgi:D-alanyl-D-alanine carboxypeptidase (penicillin-binding protein 5/6)
VQLSVLALAFSLLFTPLLGRANNAVPAPPSVSATGYLLIDTDSDTVLAAR